MLEARERKKDRDKDKPSLLLSVAFPREWGLSVPRAMETGY